ncbi:MAG: hypothetical protein AAGA48_08105 [Myxococcota bacterium]
MITWLAGLAWGAPEIAPIDEEIGLRIAGGTSFLVADKDGVPDANRLFVTTGLTLARIDATAVIFEPAFAFGYSEMERFSFRVGGNIEVEWRAKAHTSLYGSLGLHYFRSFTDPEIRKGALVRGAVGIRLATGGKAFVGFEPLAIERFPNGEGVMTPLRSRWGVEVTFISAGVRL